MGSVPIIKTATTTPPTHRLPWGTVHEYRNCTCGSTITVVLEEFDPEWD